MPETREQIIERMARTLKPHLWGDFAAKLATLSIFTPEQAEESAAKKRDEAMLNAGVMLPVAVKAVTDRVREMAHIEDWPHTRHSPNEGEPECPGCWAADIHRLCDQIDTEMACE